VRLRFGKAKGVLFLFLLISVQFAHLLLQEIEPKQDGSVQVELQNGQISDDMTLLLLQPTIHFFHFPEVVQNSVLWRRRQAGRQGASSDKLASHLEPLINPSLCEYQTNRLSVAVQTLDIVWSLRQPLSAVEAILTVNNVSSELWSIQC